MVDIEKWDLLQKAAERLRFLSDNRSVEDGIEAKALIIEIAEGLGVNFQTDRAEVVYNS